MNLVFDSNIVTRSIAYIFVNSECSGLKYRDANDKAETAYNFFKNILGFDEVTTFKDRTKTEVL